MEEIVYTFTGHLSVVNGQVDGTVECDKPLPCEAIIHVGASGFGGPVFGYMWIGYSSCTIDPGVDEVRAPITSVDINWNGEETAKIVNNVTYD